MKTVRDTSFIDLETGEECLYVKEGYIAMYTTKTSYNDEDEIIFYRTADDSGKMSSCVVSAANVEEISNWENIENNFGFIDFKDFLIPRRLVFNEAMYSINIVNGASCDAHYKKNDIVMFTTKIDLNGETYYRTEKESGSGLNCVIPSKNLSEL